jgi:DNA-binding FadR family transcriptional regulator
MMTDEWTERNESEAIVNEGLTTDASAMTAWPRRPARLGHAVVATLAGQVVSGALPEGAALPPEPVLGETFGVSRSVIRESLKVLEEKSLVVVRQGHGTTVQGRDQWHLLDPLVLKAVIEFDSTLTIFDDLIEVRASLESQMARRAANRLTESQLNELRAHLDHLDGLIPDPTEYGRAELAYHDAITRFSGNQLARAVLRTQEAFAMTSKFYAGTHRTRADNVISHRGHVAIYEQLLARDPEGAARAVQEHICGGWERYKKRLASNGASPRTSRPERP